MAAPSRPLDQQRDAAHGQPAARITDGKAVDIDRLSSGEGGIEGLDGNPDGNRIAGSDDDVVRLDRHPPLVGNGIAALTLARACRIPARPTFAQSAGPPGPHDRLTRLGRRWGGMATGGGIFLRRKGGPEMTAAD